MRAAFLILALLLLLTGCVYEAGTSEEAAEEIEKPVVTRCPKGMVNDPYPGSCGRYIDLNNNGICDNSE